MRVAIIAGGLMLAFSTLVPARAGEVPSPVATTAIVRVEIASSDGRKVPLTLTAPLAPRAVLLFSHGGGTAPDAMQAVADRFAALGYAVVMPTHTDSSAMPEAQRTSMQDAFATRIGDMQGAATFAEERFPGLPTAAIGYSYGSLFALMGGGALEPMVPGRIAGLKAVVMFSSPGTIPGLSDIPGALSGEDVPSLLVTGTADVVPGYVADPAAHLGYLDGLSAGDHTAIVVRDATHEFIRGTEPGMDEVAPLVADFLASRVLGDADAAARYAAAASTARIEIRRR